MGGVRKTAKDHFGNVYPSVDEMCAAYGMTYDVFFHRVVVKEWEEEKALTTPIKQYAKDGECAELEEDREKYVPESRRLSAEYVKYLQWKIEKLKKKQMEILQEGRVPELVGEIAGLIQEYEKRIRLIRGESFWFEIMDMYVMLDERNRKELISPNNRFLMEAKLHGVIPSTELEREIYIVFNKEYHIIDEIKDFQGMG